MTFVLVLVVFAVLIALVDRTRLPDLALRVLTAPAPVSERQAAVNCRPISSAVTPLGATSPPAHLPIYEDGRALERPAV